ncbi:hypothetical protein FHS37_007557, partial [Streptomyces griseostramineus]|nr:hypothetical protein [Streptomyces griseomycini]
MTRHGAVTGPQVDPALPLLVVRSTIRA